MMGTLTDRRTCGSKEWVGGGGIGAGGRGEVWSACCPKKTLLKEEGEDNLNFTG